MSLIAGIWRKLSNGLFYITVEIVAGKIQLEKDLCLPIFELNIPSPFLPLNVSNNN